MNKTKDEYEFAQDDLREAERKKALAQHLRDKQAHAREEIAELDDNIDVTKTKNNITDLETIIAVKIINFSMSKRNIDKTLHIKHIGNWKMNIKIHVLKLQHYKNTLKVNNLLIQTQL